MLGNRRRPELGSTTTTAVLGATAASLGEIQISHPVLDAVPANLFVLDINLDVIWMNPQAKQTLGARHDQVRRDVGPRLREQADVVAAARTGRASVPTVRIGDLLLGTSLSAVRDHSGTAVGFVAAWADISSREAARQRTDALVARLGETREVSAAVNTIANATDQVVSSVNEIGRNAGEATATVRSAIGVVEATRTTMAELGSASREISAIVQTIGAVASQTNLLALNATIEAARAGELGKGFAVVAGEVKELSRQTQTATENINRMIAEVQRLTQAGIAAIGDIAEVVEQVGANQNLIASAVEAHTAATQEISANIAGAAAKAAAIASFVADNS